jgi:hypothetical protein
MEVYMPLKNRSVFRQVIYLTLALFILIIFVTLLARWQI